LQDATTREKKREAEREREREREKDRVRETEEAEWKGGIRAQLAGVVASRRGGGRERVSRFPRLV